MRTIFLFLKLIEAYLSKKQILFQNIIAEKYYKKGGSELRCNIKDNIMMSPIIADFPKSLKKLPSHWGENIISVNLFLINKNAFQSKVYHPRNT